jgi:ferredoxin
MPTVVFEGNALGSTMSVDAADGGPLVDVCDEASAPVLFSCRAASCAICRVEVTSGHDHLEPPGDDELSLLRLVQAPPTQRLACQAVARAGPGLIRLRLVAKIT